MSKLIVVSEGIRLMNGLVPTKRHWVLLGFIIRPFLLKYVLARDRVVSVLVMMCANWMSSAYRTTSHSCIISVRSLTNIVKRMRPSIDPSGTPNFIGAVLDSGVDFNRLSSVL